MLKKICFLIFILCGLSSCYHHEKQEKPSGLIAETEMVAILVDVHLAEASGSLDLLINNTDPKKKARNITDVYTKHGVTKEQFDKSLKYYSSDPEKINAIYEKVLNDLNKLQAEAMKKK